MPRKAQTIKKDYISDFNDGIGDEENVSPSSDQPIPLPTAAKKRGKNSNYAKQESDEEQDDEQPVTSMLHQFGAEIKKNISSKRRKIESFTKQCNASRDKVDAVLEEQKKNRTLLYEEFEKQVATLLGQWQTDIDKVKESEEKLSSLWNQQIKLLSQIRVVQTQRYKSMKQLHDQYHKSVGEIESNHQAQHQSVTEDLNKELASLQRKFLMESRNQEMVNMRKSLQSMLYK